MKEAVDLPLDLASALATYLTAECGAAVRVSTLRRLSGGASHETWSFDATLASGECLPLVLRRDFVHALLGVFDAELSVEFALLQALHESGLPVPRPRWCAAVGTALSTPFMIADRANGTDLRKALATNDRRDRHPLGLALVRLQAAIHATDTVTFREILPPPPSALQEVARWACAVEASPCESPLLTAAISWLRMNAPDTPQVCLVHGDFKTNNLMFEGDRVTVLDWEMAHLGDPIEDLAWTTLWATQDDLVGGLLSKAEYLAAYETVTGKTIEAARFFYWEMFSYVKLAAIFIAGVRPSPAGTPLRPLLALLGRAIPYLEHALARLLQQTLPPTVSR